MDQDGVWWGILIEVFIFFYCFIGLAIVCDEYLVVSLETLCARWGIREDVAGVSFMAFGSAAPEIIINAVTTMKGATHTANAVPGPEYCTEGLADKDAAEAANLGVGAIIGSGIIAFLVIPGVCGVFAGQPMVLKRRPLLRDILGYSTALLLLCIFFYDGAIVQFEALLLVGGYVVFLVVVMCSPKLRQHYRVNVQGKAKKGLKKENNLMGRWGGLYSIQAWEEMRALI